MTIFFLGDIGGLDPAKEVHNHALPDLEGTSFLLGDNVYPYGIPPPGHRTHQKYKERLLSILAFIQQSVAPNVYLLPGNHDYNKGQADGQDFWRTQVEIVQDQKDEHLQVLEPTKVVSCLDIGGTRFILLNTQDVLQPGIERRKARVAQFMEDLNTALEASVELPTVVLGHHPVHSRALHGGHLSLKQHLFPLTLMNKRLVVPVPLVGSILALGRRYIGTPEDMAHRYYKQLRSGMLKVFGHYKNLVYISGHDHNLQVIPKVGNLYVVSGAASKSSFVRPTNKKYWSARVTGGFSYNTKTNLLTAFQGLADRQPLNNWAISPLMPVLQTV